MQQTLEATGAGRKSGTPATLFGYDVIDRVGQGAGSTVFVASHPATGQVVAIKHVMVGDERHERFVDQLRAEYEVGSSVRDAGLRQSLDLKVRSNWVGRPTEAALVLEWVDGVPPDRQLPERPADLADCFVRVARAVHALNARGYVHCDLKPSNVLVSADGGVKVIDLGQACAAGTRKRRIQGTPDFIAPEQVRCEPVTPRTDVFNLGATMYACLTGERLPTTYTSGRGRGDRYAEELVAAPRDVRPGVPQNWSNLVMECVRANPARRPADLAEVARRLEVIAFTLGRAAARTTSSAAAA